jgi:hypothetical protein
MARRGWSETGGVGVVYGHACSGAEEGHAMVLTGGIRVCLVAMLALALSSCGDPTGSHTAAPTARPSIAPRPSAAAGACASVATTTPIEQVPAACATLWAPYGVTKVPPANLTDATPAAPPVVNATKGAVSDTDALAWAVGANRAAIWYRWAEKYGQVSVLKELLTTSLIPRTELAALARGAEVDEPDCSSFGTRYAFFPLDKAGTDVFSGRGQHTSALEVLAVTYPGPCSIAAKFPDGHAETLFSYATSGTTVFAGSVRHDALLGDVWYSEAAIDCATQGAPKAWCPP